jgi:hypothetical protein
MKNPSDMTWQEAKAALIKKFTQSGISAKVTNPIFSNDPGFGGKKPWPHFAYRVTFAKGKASLCIDYSMGANKAEEAGMYDKLSCRTTEQKDMARRGFAMGKPTPSPDRAVVPAEVFANICSEAINAHDQSFEEWASTFGYDNDSRKAEKIYRLCADRYHEVTKLISASDMQEYAALFGAL